MQHRYVNLTDKLVHILLTKVLVLFTVGPQWYILLPMHALTYLDQIHIRETKLFISLMDRLVKDLDGNRVYGLFHHMKKGEHDDFESHLSDLRVWASQCQTANVSAGKYFAVSPSGCGQTQFTHIRLGPLQ